MLDETALSSTAALLLGFGGATLDRLRSVLNVACVISDDPSADVTWAALQNLENVPRAPGVSEERDRCLEFAKSHYWKFADIYSRRFTYISETLPEVQNAFILTFRICYELVVTRKISLLVFSNIPHEGYDYIFYLIARYLNLKIVICHQSSITNRFFLCSDMEEFGDFAGAPKLWEQEPSNYSLPTTWFYMSGTMADPTYQFSQFVQETINNPRGALASLTKYHRAKRYRRDVLCTRSVPLAGERYVYFPLHLQPELTTSALGGRFADQLSALELLSSMVPPDTYIYAKENPKQTEMQRGPLFFRRLRLLSNVRLVDRTISSIDLIKGSKAVAVITGTAGWEALFHRKPVLIFGRAWYAEFKGVTRFQYGLSFDAVVTNEPPTVEDTVAALDALLTRAGKGIVDPDYKGSIASFDEVRNAELVTNSILAFLSRSDRTPQ